MTTNSHLFGPVYSSQNALGIIIATGSVGNYLSLRKDNVNTFISIDGGHNWKEI